MANSAPETKSSGHPKASEYEEKFRAEMAEVRHEIAALAKSIGGQSKERVADLQDRAAEMSEEVLDESRRALKKLGKQVANLEKDMEVRVREHPLQWFLGALGVGLVLAMLVRRGE